MDGLAGVRTKTKTMSQATYDPDPYYENVVLPYFELLDQENYEKMLANED